MDMTTLSSIVSMLVILSIASERLVEILKGFVPYLNETKQDPKAEAVRKAVLHILAVVSGIFTAYFSIDVLASYLPGTLNSWVGIIGFGLLASGGSGFWNSILGYVNEVKKIKKREAAGQP